MLLLVKWHQVHSQISVLFLEQSVSCRSYNVYVIGNTLIDNSDYEKAWKVCLKWEYYIKIHVDIKWVDFACKYQWEFIKKIIQHMFFSK